MSKIICLLGAFDTKGPEYQFVRDCIESRGHRTLTVDFGVAADPAFAPDVNADQVARAGGSDLKALREKQDRGEAMAVMTRGVTKLIPKLHAQGRFDGILALGGGGGTSVACAAMRALPLGVPKVMVSTVAGGDVSAYVGTQDIAMIPAIVDVAGINKISRGVFARAAGAICGMLETQVADTADKPVIVASMFGNTTPAVQAAKAILEAEGYEVLIFHATGTGGRTMESLIDAGLVAGVLDITTTEWADQLLGGVMAAGPHRLEAAARQGIPAVIAPGCLDMVNFRAPETMPPQFAVRKIYRHNPDITLMRTNVEENQQLGRIIAEKLNASRGPVTVVLPNGGLSMIDAPGQPFHWPEADAALFSALRQNLRDGIRVIALDCNINDPLFAATCAEQLLGQLR